MTQMAKFANKKSQYALKIWVELNETSFMIAMSIGFWTLIFNFALNYSGREGTEGYLVLVSVVIYAAAWYLQLQ